VSPLALALIVIAAFVHVVPHAAIKQADDRNAFVWWMLLGNTILYAPLLVIEVPHTRVAWMLIIVSGFIEAIYLLAISRAYALGSLSMVYPIARGSAPLFLLASSIAFLAERPTPPGIAGILLISLGVFGALSGNPAAGQTGNRKAALAWSLLSGLMTATYTTVDKVGIQFVQPLVYIYLVLVVTLVIYTPVVLSVAPAILPAGAGTTQNRIVATFRSAGPIRIAVAAIAMPLAYALVLTAMRLGMPASYAGSLREMSVIVAAAIGIGFFGEPITRGRIAGACAIAAGIALIAFRG
jgi:drug/metabolite transporter (DMT)-like permease